MKSILMRGFVLLVSVFFLFQCATTPKGGKGEAAFDFGDMKSSTLTTKAWEAYGAGKLDAVLAYTGKCMELYGNTALEQQKALNGNFASKGTEFEYWALNDVGTCYFIRGAMYADKRKKDEAIADFEYLLDNLSFAQCWDPKGWFWQVANAAAERLDKIQ